MVADGRAVRQMILAAVESVVNAALSTDPECCQALESYIGQRVRISPEGIPGSVDLEFGLDGIRLRPADTTSSQLEASEACELEPDVELRGAPSALLRLLGTGLSGQGSRSLPAGVEVKGDVGLLDSLRSLAANLSVDWEELLARRVGDRVAHQLFRRVAAGRDWLQDQEREGAAMVGEWLRYESRLVVSREELERWCTDVDELREICDRLEARVNRLAGGSSSRSGDSDQGGRQS